MKKLFLLMFSGLFIFSCATNRDSQSGKKVELVNKKESAFDNPNIAVDLTTRLKSYPGIRVLGDGAGAVITIRGINSMSDRNQPLFLLDNNQVGSYGDLYSMVSTSSIKRIQVLKNPDEIGFYGVRGANGVIKVTTVK